MMQEDSSASYLEMLFGATSISDFFSRIEHIRAMIEYDRKLSKEYKAKKEELQTKKADFEKSVALQAETLKTLEADKAQTDKLAKDAEKYISALEADNAQYQAELDKATKAEAELDKKLTIHLPDESSRRVVIICGLCLQARDG